MGKKGTLFFRENKNSFDKINNQVVSSEKRGGKLLTGQKEIVVW